MLAGGEDKVAILDAGTQFAKVCNQRVSYLLGLGRILRLIIYAGYCDRKKVSSQNFQYNTIRVGPYVCMSVCIFY